MTTASKTPTYPTSDYPGGTATAEAAERLGEKTSYAAEKVKAGFEQASEALSAGMEDLDALQEEWLANVRGYVQEHPLASVAAALAVGVLLARLLTPPR